MITQEITPYTEPPYQYERGKHWVAAPWKGGHDRPSDPTMTKLEYAMFIRDLPIKAGDFVMHVSSRPPVTPYQIYKVESIDEIHRLVAYHDIGIGPMCLNLQSRYPMAPPFKGGALQYKVVKPEDVPEDWESR